MTEPFEQLNAYINRDHATVKGWLSQQDMVMMACAGVAQIQLGVRGHIGEIGVYNGKSLLLLSYLLRADESAYGFDLFEAEDQQETRANLARLAPPTARVLLTKANTLDLSRGRLDDVFPGRGSLRFLHVDGGHEYFEVLHDLMLFAPYLRDDAILLLDDYHDREYPGVNLAIEHFCALEHPNRAYAPFMEGANKLFLCRKPWIQPYHRALLRMPALNASLRITEGPGHGVLIPFSRYPMPVEDIEKVVSAPADFVLGIHTGLKEINALARMRGSQQMVNSMARAGKATKDFL